MFNNSRKFINLFRGAFFANLLPKVFQMKDNEVSEEMPSYQRSGKGKGRRSPAPKNSAAHKRASKKAKGRAINKARHAA